MRPLPDWDQLTFAFSETDEVYCASGEAGQDPLWDAGRFLPFGDIPISPAAGVFGYGIGVFEGLKAHRAPDGRVLLFRDRDNARRMQHSADRLVMPPFPEDQFCEAVAALVRRNIRFLPPHGKGSFYIRPMQLGCGPQLGIRPATSFRVVMFGCPVGGYFAPGSDDAPRGLRLRVLEQGRCAAGGTGAAKAVGNYAGGLLLAQRWKQQGFDDVLYLDAQHRRYLTETSGSNVFARLRSGVLVTPPLDDQILPGITRDSVIRLARELFGLTVEERPLAIEETLADAEELFCSGTAYTVRNVEELSWRDQSRRFESTEVQHRLLEELAGIQRGQREDRFSWTRAIG